MTTQKPTKAPGRFLRLLEKAMQEHPDALSLREVARQADISPAYLSRLLSGERGVPSNDAIAQLERVLHIPQGDLFKAAERPDDQALEFFRKDEAGSIMRTLAPLPNSQLAEVHKLIERFVKKQNPNKGK
ncbi:MAG TPA: helix-turn-helix transcriptional regulator [Candidatus Paceibacterota bacterium]|nr:helix-turn-helix transcriptional regulator [Candidatus Paceibacterota bacterium]